ncbi:uncharacterized protein LOC115443008 [Manduca sexta]|uniref:Uncharacterized protein n=1 Tax=Manduca sexta TaxID=7130 RepID=A0A921YLA0_MANSE|nr:uncharacterized protein LOC115443008 [Manduca sexta]KAG6440954.1 hypothetical protein O3G_MSEX001556 [Manduca sexta]
MAYSSDIHKSHQAILTLDSNMKLTSSASEQNVYFTYVCLVNDIKPSENMKEYNHNKPNLHHIDHELEEADEEDPPIQVERSKALHELIERHKKSEKDLIVVNDTKASDSSAPNPPTTSGETRDPTLSETAESGAYENPNILQLTKMKWLTEDRENAPDSSSPSLSPTCSDTSSNFSGESEENLNKRISLGDKYLSTIIQLDKEHNMFGLSNITIVGSRQLKRVKKDDERPVFHQTAIVQICCKKGCCKHKSNTDLPGSLKCGGCRGCCVGPCSSCLGPCGPPCPDPPCQPLCISCPKGKCSCKMICPPVKCMIDCATCFGFKVSVNKKPKYEPSPVELTPRSSCVLQRPLAARSCHHLPQCIPPSSCFPYLMPCFWPARPSAPCSTPARCFHNPPCPPARIPRSCIPPEESCPRIGKCEDPSKKTKCSNLSCLGNNASFKKEFESRFGKH